MQMSEAGRGICYVNRFPPAGAPKLPYSEIGKLVKQVDGFVPTDSAMCQAARDYNDEKQKRGRKTGWRKTSKVEDKKIMEVFHTARPPGCGIDSRQLRNKLPRNLKKKVIHIDNRSVDDHLGKKHEALLLLACRLCLLGSFWYRVRLRQPLVARGFW